MIMIKNNFVCPYVLKINSVLGRKDIPSYLSGICLCLCNVTGYLQ